MNIKFSIITVCFNSEKTIKETIESVINQSYKNYEHIIIDGNSTDNTLSLIKDYSNKSDKIKFISEPDTGIYNAMNKGIKIATGDLIVFLNSDDTFEENALNIISENFTNQVDLIYGNVSWQEDYKGIIFEKELDLNPFELTDSIMTLTEEHLRKMANAHNATFVKSSIMKENLFDENLKICSDYKFFLRMYKQKRKVKYIPYKITKMKMGGVSTTQLEQGLYERVKCENEILGYSNLNISKRTRNIKKTKIIKSITRLFLPSELYIKFRYLNKGWKKI